MQLPGRRSRLTIVGLVAAVAMVAAALAVTALASPPAAALGAATPADGSNLARPPAELALTFTAAVARAHVEVSGDAGVGEPAVDGTTVRQPLGIAADGRYAVAYHVVTRDGAEVDGTLSFVVGDPALAGPVAAPELDVPTEAGHGHGGEADAVTAVLVGVNALALLAGGIVVLLRRLRRRRV